MAYIAEFQKLHISIRSIVISVVIIMPFWLVVFYFTKPELVVIGKLYMGVLCSFCISLFHFMANFFIIFLISTDSKEDDDILPNSVLTSLFSTLILSGVLFVGTYFNISLRWVIYCCMIISVLLLIIGLIDNAIDSVKKNKSKKKKSR